jgi:hypothetical protein
VCGNGEVTQFFDVLSAAATAYIDPSASGNLAEIAKKYFVQQVRNKVGGSFQSFLDANGPRSPYGNCAPLAAQIPKDATVVVIHLGDWDDSVGVGACAPRVDCANGWAKFTIAPESENTSSGQVISTLFNNWSHDRDRVARMFVSYRMPAGKKPTRYE